MSQNYVVYMPKAEARYLAGVGMRWPPTPAARCGDALREWLNGLRDRQSEHVAVHAVIDDLDPLLDRVPVIKRPASGPFASRGGGPPLPGQVEYLGEGAVRLDDAAVSALAGLREDQDFRITITDMGPILWVGADQYLVREEELDATSS